jgi:hypothetical protein
MDQYMETVRRGIEKYGWTVQGVFPTEEDPGPYFCYTVGLLERGCAAEIMVVGLPLELGARFLNEIAASMVNGTGLPPSTWDLPGGLVMLPVFITKQELPLLAGAANNYYGRRIPVVQYVWPLENNVYPWDEAWPYGEDVQPVGGAGRPTQAS